ncbi:polymorphic toxin-type HINT domain-containing protein [Tuwongella immobilis]|uniref:Hint domain-containing protein n=1 Tax=Tuwongella immobilis TaxID=692036 RepID=A0A6C2YP75_9BACT|nr:polymorphic toxin-type HINT domain-containing protein [Tuwongella immobilis]VIP02999.1 rhs repeat-associated core domain protein : RHS repeat-associated core domain protein OS=Paenibacillus sp. oral taxon 786 str. D14 GN=POTG_00766 PE=4 SV=1: PT-HINT [Tuwongella immobilis]VTS03085.1 rhs repeat-associated core domain protein : RHS repeat-associated core domain protein OS=Paenibacillus sp. oral taxon 786 str. D14 GN=POTG_00766 PE=4 SV=1: PT-HINT [Tuwongella immobilis]
MQLEDGTRKPIEEIGFGERVLSRDEHSPESPASGKVVEEVFVRTAEILRLTLTGGVTIDTTGEHPFFEESLGWIEARSLPPSHRLRTFDGTSIAVESLAETGTWQPVFDLRVADWHPS